MYRAFRGLTLFVAVALLVLWADRVGASTILYRTDAQLVALSDRVVHARVIAQRVVRGGTSLDRIYTVTTLQVLEDLTGVSGDEVEVWELGGTIGDSFQFVGGQVTYQLGDEVVVCLGRGANGLHSVAMSFSKFDVRPSVGGAQTLRRSVSGLVVVGAPAATAERSLDEFRRVAEQVTGRPSRRVIAAPREAVPNAQAPYTFLGQQRWAEADSGTPVLWRRNLTASSPLTSGNVDTEIGLALAAWTNPPSASIVLQFAGTTTQADPMSGFTGGVVTFEDPTGEIAPPILAIGGGGCSFCTTSMVNGITFKNITTAFVIFDNAATLDPLFRQPPNFTRVLEHEIGHTIGLGHTDDDFSVVNPHANIMNSACCYPEAPIPPAIGLDDLAGLNFLYPSNPNGPKMELEKTFLSFGAVRNGTAFSSQTSTQLVRLTQTGAGPVTWTATSDQPWLQVNPASGSGSANISVSVVATGAPADETVSGGISFSFVGASTSPGPIEVQLTVMPAGASLAPFGTVDTPADARTGVTGAVPFTGWALDDVEMARVSVCRSAFGSEVAPIDPNCGGTAQIFVGFGVFIDGARPDVEAVFPEAPFASRAGWGFMVLTNMLPNQGNGTYTFHVWARDQEGHATRLGSRTMTCANASATLPFGAIDTPEQGGFASGSSYVNFGWALTPQPKTIPIDGSTITVLVDGASVGTASYNNFRSDIAALFPGLNNSNGAVGFKYLDTTTLTNGTHTIVWVVSDSANALEGIGSRFFTVSNGASGLTAAATADRRSSASSVTLSAISSNPAPILGRRGWDLDAPLRVYERDAAGIVTVHSEEVNRVELHLGAGYRAGYLRTPAGLRPLPIGSRFAPETGVFTWAPGVGFIGTYQLTFETGGPSTLELRIVLHPKKTGARGPQVVIDTPRWQQDVGQPFMLAGWAADLDAVEDTGISTLHAWAYPLTGGPPVFLGAAMYGGARPDVAGTYGAQFEGSGFGIVVQGLEPGNYDLAVFPWSTERADFAPATVVRATVRDR